MGDVPKDIYVLLTQLLPGFLTAWVIYGLTSHPRPSQFERVIQALIYSLIIGVLVALEQKILLRVGQLFSLGAWDKTAELIASASSALVLGLIFAYFSQNDAFYLWARKHDFTQRTAYPSEWYGAFTTLKFRYVVLHLLDGRRISGYPIEWPSVSEAGHFRLRDAAWLDDDNSEVRLDADHSLLIQAKSVELVEFLKTDEERADGTKATEPVSPTAKP